MMNAPERRAAQSDDWHDAVTKSAGEDAPERTPRGKSYISHDEAENIKAGLSYPEPERTPLCAHYDQRCVSLVEAYERIAALEQEQKKLRLKSRIVDRLPFCPDHRDKVHGEPCRECEVERLRAENEQTVKELQDVLASVGMRLAVTSDVADKTFDDFQNRALTKPEGE